MHALAERPITAMLALDSCQKRTGTVVPSAEQFGVSVKKHNRFFTQWKINPGSEEKPKTIYTDNCLEFGKSCEESSWNHCQSP